ncbi:YusU family protein [Falsibacillus pallidus]|uniref:YusU family protein n=1 Tax=Falsibacillus pallidus TaxID=493781 RepID=UPI003D99188D
MNKEFNEQFDALIEKYTELLTGKSDRHLNEKIEKWALYTYISKTMPSLVKHWNGLYPDAKDSMKEIIMEIKQLNEEHRSQDK